MRSSLALVLLPLVAGNGQAPIRFTDVTEKAGVRFHHEQGASGRRYMVEIAGGGVVVFDYDDDGRPDLYFVNGAPLPGDHDPWKGNALFRNLGDGRFADVTQLAKLQGSGYGMGGAAADADNDGDIDLLVTSFGRNLFFKNNGDGTFTDATDASGIDDETWSASAAFSDLDRDGFVDLYVTNYLDFTLETHRECVSPQREIPSYCHPQEYDGVMDRVYRNERNGVFADVTLSAGAAVSELGKGLGVVASDYDGDGDADLYVANDTTRNFLFQNQGDGTFHEVGLEAGVAYNEEGLTEAGMGTDWGDVDRDGLADLIVTNFDFETNTLYRNLGSGFFLDATAASGLGHVSLTELGFGCDLADFDNDGWLDLVVTNGHILDNIAELQSNLSFAQPAQFFRNEGGRFREESELTGEALSRPRVGRGLATLDFDGDGDLDLVLSNNGGAAELLENEGGNRNPSLSLRLLGTISNRDGIGARVRGEGVLEELRAGSSYLSQNELVIHLGLGDATDVRGLVLRWPSGAEYDLPTLDAGRRYVIKEGAGVIGRY